MDDYPIAFDSYSREISLPIYPELDSIKIDFIVNAVAAAYHLARHLPLSSGEGQGWGSESFSTLAFVISV